MKPKKYMPRFLCMVLFVGFSLMGVAPNGRAARLDIRLVAADDSGKSNDPRLADLLPLLGGNLKFSSFALIARKNVSLQPADGISLGKGYSLALSDVAGDSVRIQVTHGRTKLLETKLRLRPGRPVLVGGFPDDGKTLIIVITMRDH